MEDKSDAKVEKHLHTNANLINETEGVEVAKLNEVDSRFSWLIALTGFAVMFVTFGTASIFGVYLIQYASLDFAHEPKSLLSLVGGLGPAIASITCIPSGAIMAIFGPAVNLIPGGIMLAAGLTVASFATRSWHLFVGQSVMAGVALGLSFIPTMSLVPQWFDKHRGVAVGLTAAGTGVGGLVLAPTIQAIIDAVRWRWALRVNAIIALIVLLPAGMILRPRVPLQRPKQVFELEIIADPKFVAMWLMGLSLCFAYWVPFFIMPLYCKYYGISSSTASLIVGIMNGASAIGRVAMGKVSDQLGSINTLIFSNFICSLSFVVVWHFSTQTWSLILFALVFGIASGAFFTVPGVIIPQLFGFEKLARVNGPFYTCSAPGFMLGSMIGTAIINLHTTATYTNYLPFQFYLFACYFLSCVALVWLRFQTTKFMLVKV